MHVKKDPATSSRLARAAWLALGALLVAGCRREEVTYHRVPKEQPASPMLASAGAMPPEGAAQPGAPGSEVAPPPRPAGGLRWSLPKGWTEEVAGGMRYATLRAPVQGKVDVSVVVLPGPAGGELANVNRWRGQIGLPPTDDAALAAARKVLATKAGPVNVYDFANEEKKSRTIAALAEVDGSTWFVKLSGDAAPVAAVRPDFLRLLESLRRGTN